VQAWRKYLDTFGRRYEIFLIQETRVDVADAVPANVQADRVFPYDRSAGYRDAVNEAIRAAQHPLLAFSPADRQYQPADLEHLLKVIDKVDLAVGYRSGGQAPPWRVLLDMATTILARIFLGLSLEPRVCWLGSTGWGHRWIARWIFGVRVTDPECPFRLTRRDIFQRMPIQAGGPFMLVEMLAKANHLSCYLAEEPVTWMPPTDPAGEAISFGQDARLVFGAPTFGRLSDTLPCRA
jgi:hypothetical protein